MLFLPELVPRNVQSTGEIDEELLLIQQEAQLKLEADSIRDDMRDTAPLGAALTTASVEEPTPEEEEEEEEEEEGEDDDDASDGQDDEQEDTDDEDDTLDASI
ncbi:hypothetical protein ABBQ38_012554 [Trebouxia sp. C0009 RCD-2024]